MVVLNKMIEEKVLAVLNKTIEEEVLVVLNKTIEEEVQGAREVYQWREKMVVEDLMITEEMMVVEEIGIEVKEWTEEGTTVVAEDVIVEGMIVIIEIEVEILGDEKDQAQEARGQDHKAVEAKVLKEEVTDREGDIKAMAMFQIDRKL